MFVVVVVDVFDANSRSNNGKGQSNGLGLVGDAFFGLLLTTTVD